MAKNPIMVAAGKKAAATRRKNQETTHQKWVQAGLKAWETRRKNQKKSNKQGRTNTDNTVNLSVKELDKMLQTIKEVQQFIKKLNRRSYLKN